MNWDITIGQVRQTYGRFLQRVGMRWEKRSVILDGERMEYEGRLQHRYGTLKHQAQWGFNPDVAMVRESRHPVNRKKSAG
jgi:hypothetical protein